MIDCVYTGFFIKQLYDTIHVLLVVLTFIYVKWLQLKDSSHSMIYAICEHVQQSYISQSYIYNIHSTTSLKVLYYTIIAHATRFHVPPNVVAILS